MILLKISQFPGVATSCQCGLIVRAVLPWRPVLPDEWEYWRVCSAGFLLQPAARVPGSPGAIRHCCPIRGGDGLLAPIFDAGRLDSQRTLSGAQNELGQLKLKFKRLQATVSLYKALGSR